MRFNPEYSYRKSARLKNYDYSSDGAYFITICTQGRQAFFGEIIGGHMVMNAAGQMVDSVWREIPSFYSGIELGIHIVMPNHFHGIIHITDQNYHERCVGADPRVRPDADTMPDQGRQQNHGRTQGSAPTQRVSLPGMMQRFKALTTRRYIQGVLLLGWPEFHIRLWQRSYHEHIIRNDDAHQNIAQYIETNPQRWPDDLYHPSPASEST